MLRRWLPYVALGLILSVDLVGQPSQAQLSATVQLTPITLPEAEVTGTAYVPEGLTRSARPIDGPLRAIVHTDDRTPVLSRQYPWSAIGRVDWVDDTGAIVGSCTGTLVGSQIVLTNAHCLIDEATDQPTQLSIVFRPNLIQGRSEDVGRVIAYEYGDSPFTGDQTEDWALLTLDRPLGERYGYLGWRTLDFDDTAVLAAIDGQIGVAGYSADFPPASLSGFGNPGETAGLSAYCSILLAIPEGHWADSLIHSCDTNPGASGAPLLALFEDDEYYIVGLHTGSVSLLENVTLPTGEQTDVLNRGIPVSRWSSRAAALR